MGHFRPVGCVPLFGVRCALRMPILTEFLSTCSLSGIALFCGRACFVLVIFGHQMPLSLPNSKGTPIANAAFAPAGQRESVFVTDRPTYGDQGRRPRSGPGKWSVVWPDLA